MYTVRYTLTTTSIVHASARRPLRVLRTRSMSVLNGFGLASNDTNIAQPFGNIHPVEDVRVARDVHTRAPVLDVKKAPTVLADPGSMTYSNFIAAVKNGNVIDVVISSNNRLGRVGITVEGGYRKEYKVVFPEDYDIVNFLVANKVNVAISESDTLPMGGVIGKENMFEKSSKIFLTVIQVFLQVAFIAMLINLFISAGGNKSGGAGMFGMTDSKASLFDSTMITTRFTDVAGAENAKRELSEIVDFLQNPDKYTKLGARIPKGVLLYGPPGCGKTLLARSVAGEAGVPFFSTAGSSMVEMFVGVAAARIRDMFNKAKNKSPCIIFIDEIDAIGKARSNNIGTGANDERDQALNQLLTEMDGFDGNTGVIVIAATNRPDILDEALTRPGRFDRRVSVEYPDLNGRTDILRVHTQGMPLADDIDLKKLGMNTIGFTGADLKNLCNEAAIYAARASSENVNAAHFEQSLEKLTMGEAHSTALISAHKRKVVAYHEAGHTLLGLLVGNFDNIRKVSITPRGNAGGATYFEPNEDNIDNSLMTRDYLENRLIVTLGGRVAEEFMFGNMGVTTGASGDFEMVTSLAKDMVCRFGFNEEIGPMYVDDERVAGDVDMEMRFHVNKAYTRAVSMLKDNEFYLHRIAEALIEKETLNEADIYTITNGLSCKLNGQERARANVVNNRSHV
ncbi:ATP-dependent zinc metalloprotease [Dishui Lake large algae virus 1]|nr:ATP-dependent zinc metalloprotease [Dishui Lake large algae virus 1]